MSEQRVAIVTGGVRGIGAAITTRLAEQGIHVAAGYSRGDIPAKELQERLTKEGHSISIHSGNVGEPADCQRVVDEVLALKGRVDILVNNAGVTVDKTVRKMTVEDWHAVLRVNLSGTFYMVKAVLETMIAQNYGRIVNISSAVGATGSIGQANYAASKSGQFGFSKSLAREVARKGITVNCVTPGYTETEMVAAIPENVIAGILPTIPVGRFAQPDEVARAVTFLTDDAAGYITGAAIAVNGGWDMA
ncbi:MAG TPA: 3-oxoacyl-ACP reductase [Sporichthyaceae bacterium]|jgi:NAD(P)-dependent dehydrogenase (short-subunit alcohol dehydrogenase family)|nr:3-oxoacyl-ACP reductase [Sporichthyaceae bacterium]